MKDCDLEDIANLHPDVYAQTSPRVLTEVYDDLNERRSNLLREVENPIYLIIGPGRSVTPDAWEIKNGKLAGSNRNALRSEIGNGRLLLMDYSLDGLNQSMETLRKLGFFDEGYFLPNHIFGGRGVINPRQLPSRSITPIYGDLRDSILIEEGTVDLTEVSVCAHHTYPTHRKAVEVFSGIRNATRPRGSLLLAEGNVGISDWIEQKTLSVARDFVEIEGREVYIFDGRDRINERLRIYRIVPGEKYEWFPDEVSFRGNNFNKMRSKIHLAGDGSIRLCGKIDPCELVKELTRRGYNRITVDEESRTVKIPSRNLHEIPDFINYWSIENFYKFIAERIGQTQTESIEAIRKEQNDAMLDRVEFYRSKDNLTRAIFEAGWTQLSTLGYKSTPFYTLIAKKED